MHKGIVKSFDRDCGMGLIRRGAKVDVRFYASSVIVKDREALAQGDPVLFEIGHIHNLRFAVNVRRFVKDRSDQQPKTRRVLMGDKGKKDKNKRTTQKQSKQDKK